MLMGNIYVIVLYKVMVPLPECQHIAKSFQDESDRGLISCIEKSLNPWIIYEELLAWPKTALYLLTDGFR